MSAAPIRTRKPLPRGGDAGPVAGHRRGTGTSPRRRPVPTSQSPSRRARPAAGRARPTRSARRRGAGSRRGGGARTSCPDSGSISGSLRTRRSIGSTPVATASSSIATSRANMPGISPGARIHEGTATSSGGEPVARVAVGRGIHVPGRDGGLLGELLDDRGLLDDVVVDRRGASRRRRRRAGRAGSSPCDSPRGRTSAAG